MRVRSMIVILLLLISQSVFSEQNRIASEVMGGIKSVLANPTVFSTGGPSATELLVQLDTNSIVPITDEEKSSLLKTSGKYIFTDKYNKRFSFKADFTDIWTGKKISSYFGIDEYSPLDFTKAHPFPKDITEYPEIKGFIENELFGACVTNPKPSKMPDKYYFTLDIKNKTSLKIVAYSAYIKQPKQKFWLTFINKSNKTIIGFKATLELKNKFDETILYPVTKTFLILSDAENIAPNTFARVSGPWDILLVEGVKKIVPTITKIYYEDGSIEEGMCE